MAHEHDAVLAEVKVLLLTATDVAQVYSDDDTQWWVEDSEHQTFAFAWYDGAGVLNTRPYKP
jgi:hypothetical protein